MNKALGALLTGALFALALSGCAHHHGPRPGQLRLGMVTDVGGLGDKSFNDSAYGGLLQARSRLGAYVQVLQSRSAADYQPNLDAFTNLHVDMIYAIGFLMSLDPDQIAQATPSQRYAIIDAVVDDPNVVSVTFREQDGSFLAGALAAMFLFWFANIFVLAADYIINKDAPFFLMLRFCPADPAETNLPQHCGYATLTEFFRLRLGVCCSPTSKAFRPPALSR